MTITYTYSSTSKRRRLSSTPPSSPSLQRQYGDASSEFEPCSPLRDTPPSSPTPGHDEENDGEHDASLSHTGGKAGAGVSEEKTRAPLAPIANNTLAQPPPLTKSTSSHSYHPSHHPSLTSTLAPSDQTKQKRRKKLTQTTLNLTTSLLHPSASQHRTCPLCGMHFNTTQTLDRRLHARYCDATISAAEEARSGVRFTRFLFRDEEGKGEGVRVCASKGVGKEGRVVEVVPGALDRRRDLRKLVAKILDLVERELGAVPIPKEEVFGGAEGYRVFLYVGDADAVGVSGVSRARVGLERKRKGAREARCVGMLLTERVGVGRLVDLGGCASPAVSTAEGEGEEQGTQHTSITGRAAEVQDQIQHESTPGEGRKLLGISRIYVASTHRGQGIAKELLDAAFASFLVAHDTASDIDSGSREDCARGVGSTKEARKDLVAFSQPTESGARLARSWTRERVEAGKEERTSEGEAGERDGQKRDYLVYV